MGASSAATTPFRKLFNTLKDAKELLGIIIFVVGAVSFIVNYFATKAQVAELQCEMHKKIAIATSEIYEDLLDLELNDVERRRKEVQNLLATSSGAKEHLDEEYQVLNERRNNLAKRRLNAENLAHAAHLDLENHSCSGSPKVSGEISP